MSIKVGLSHSEDDIDIQGEIDFDFFESGGNEDAAPLLVQDTALPHQEMKDPAAVNNSSSSPPPPAQNDDMHHINQAGAERQGLLGASDHDNSLAVDCASVKSSLSRASVEEAEEATFSAMETNGHGSSEGSSRTEIASDEGRQLLGAGLTPRSTCGSDVCSCPETAKLNHQSSSCVDDLEDQDSDADLDDEKGAESLSSSVSVTDSDDLSSLTGDSLGGLSDSESITDVTPLHSPYYCDSPIPQARTTSRVVTSSLAGYSKDTEGRLYQSKLTDSAGESSKSSDGPSKKMDNVKFTNDAAKDVDAKDPLDLDLVVEAIRQLEVQKKAKKSGAHRQCITPPLVKGRKNMSFSNEEVRRIDRDNQMLLKKILSQQGRSKAASMSTLMCGSHRASSAVNRQKQQKQIEMENLALLKRIESAKPSKDLCRDHLLKDYNRLAGIRHGSRSTSRPSSVMQQPNSSLIGSVRSSRSSSLSSLQSGSRSLEQPKSLAPLHSRIRNIRSLNGRLPHSSSSSSM